MEPNTIMFVLQYIVVLEMASVCQVTFDQLVTTNTPFINLHYRGVIFLIRPLASFIIYNFI